MSVDRRVRGNTLYDKGDKELLREGMLLRLRQVGERA